ncbi:MAG: amphi-Trp domain-containing protein [Desulfamplus sp.]|nr:amphi-Trp domain-containing protein [Desulfamplus sp.]
MKKQEMNIKHELSVEETVDLFNEIAKSISEGTISIEYGEKQITLKTGCRFDVMIEATQKKGKQKLNIELSWKDEDSKCSSKPVLKISSQEPIVEETAELAEAHYQECKENDKVNGDLSDVKSVTDTTEIMEVSFFGKNENADPSDAAALSEGSEDKITDDESDQTASKF